MIVQKLRTTITVSQTVMANNKHTRVLPDYKDKKPENCWTFRGCLIQEVCT